MQTRLILTPDETVLLWAAIECRLKHIESLFGPHLPLFWRKEHVKSLAMSLTCGLALDAGLRPCEIAGLSWGFVQGLDTDLAYLNVAVETAKRGSARQLTCSSRLADLLRRALVIYSQWLKPESSWPVVVGHQPRLPACTRTLQRYATEFTTLALTTPRTIYDLRHTFATNLLRVTNTRVVQHALGHKKLSSTQVYTHVQSCDLAEAISRMESSTNGD